MNKAKKGYNKEKRARDELVKDGYKIVFKSIRWRFGCIDYAGIFDVVAIKGKERVYVSCKHFGKSNNYLPHQEEIKKFKEDHGLEGESFQLWIWHSPRYTGRGENKIWNEGHWDKIIL